MIKNFKLILSSLREYKKYAIYTPILMIVEVVCECSLPFIMSNFIAEIQNHTEATPLSMQKIWIYAAIFLSVAILSLTCGILGAFTSARASVGLTKNLRLDIFKRIESFSFANIDKFTASSLVTRLTTDISNTFFAFNMGIRIVVRAPLMLIFATTMSFVVGGVYAFIFIAIIPVVAVGFFFILRKAVPIYTRVFKRYDKVNESIQENILGMRVVKNFVREDFESKKFNKASDDLNIDFKKAERIVALGEPLMNTSVHITNVIVLAFGGWAAFSQSTFKEITGKVIWGDFNIGTLSSLMTYGVQILMSLMMVTIILAMFAMSLESMRRICEVLREESTIKNPEHPIYELDDGSVDFNNVTFKYSLSAKRNTLDPINLNIKSGEFIGVIGATGSGKTTLINLISRLYDITSGELLVGGHKVCDYDLVTLRDNVAVVLQKNVLFSGTIKENLMWGDKNASDERIIEALKLSQAYEFVMAMPEGINTYIEQGGTNVSGGQRQRLCIARALLKKPKILILDDSTSAVDTKTDALIRSALKNNLSHVTKIIIAQRTSSISEADKIIVMDNGHIDQIGTHDELLKTNKIYQEVYNTQNIVNESKKEDK